MKYATVCSGIEAPSIAWQPLGWEPVWFSEIAPFPSAVLQHWHPNVPNLGDMLKLLNDERSIANIDVLLGGTPCQSFSQAGNGKGLDDPRGQLAVKFFEIIDRLRPTWVVWENVPREIAACLDASYNSKWGSNQWVDSGGALIEDVAKTLTTGEGYRLDPTMCNFKGTPQVWSIVPQNSGKDYKARNVSVAQTVTTNGHFQGNQGGDIVQEQLSVRRYTPLEAERLQGFPDNYTKIPYKGKPAEKCPDGPRYEGIGNSIATPVLRWIGERIQLVDNIISNYN